MTKYTVQFGSVTIPYAVTHSRSKSLKITVSPDREVAVVAPVGTPLERIAERVAHRGGWIVRQLEHFRRYPPAPAPRRYVSGETHLYLGRQYRLKVIQADQDVVKLTRGYFEVYVKETGDPHRVERLLTKWFAVHAREALTARLEKCLAAVQYFDLPAPKGVLFRNMAKRWGSCTAEGVIMLNTKLVHVPVPCIDYVIIHELCHLKHPNHSPAFYAL